MKREFALYLIVGVINTFVGLGIIYIALEPLGLHYLWANALGYGFALICSYFLNSSFTFKSAQKGPHVFLKFLVVFGISYASTQVVVIVLVENSNLEPFLATIFGMAFYTIFGFLLNRKVVFS